MAQDVRVFASSHPCMKLAFSLTSLTSPSPSSSSSHSSSSSSSSLYPHKFQADYDRGSKQKLSETIESQQEELHRAQAEELHRRDQQLLHEQLLKQNWDLREAHEKSLKEMEELKGLKKFQSSTFDTIPRRTFDTIARRRLVEDQNLLARYKNCKMKSIV